ncbi:DHHC zinc finger domain containing protein, putative [Babesia bigemina]|uniref:Palmitoyltransferase n=1 Tax=Babesia bigemina TaxID=5866 RepID=A0A061D503_BABBI|nr:DHHC zinc finger domain containing protein, putative [Babesia bigemina]CDR95127.1 DHHC zinc finger domain containing protein, putative [Babesia bigemina]|eukprot:XP_012767313.1 DHHC zinc finger domain containing protein, putative [Babesia bigemina]
MSRCCGSRDHVDGVQEGAAPRHAAQRFVDAVKQSVHRFIEDERIIKLVTLLLLYTPVIYFAATAFGWYTTYHGPGVPTVIYIIAALALICFHAVSCMNPGIIPKMADSSDAYDAIRMKRKYSYAPPCIEVAIAGKFLRVKYCHTCNIYRPPRSVHCNVCDVCVHRFDHHCKWLRNCIGGNNYRVFYLFITCTCLENILFAAFSILRIVMVSTNYWDTAAIIHSAVLLSYMLLCGWFIVGLTAYHTYIIGMNKTTNEQLKALYTEYNPWNRGIMRNIADTMFSRAKMQLLCNATLKARPIYDPGRSVPIHLTKGPLVGDQTLKGRRPAFDVTSEEPWERTDHDDSENGQTDEAESCPQPEVVEDLVVGAVVDDAHVHDESCTNVDDV